VAPAQQKITSPGVSVLLSNATTPTKSVASLAAQSKFDIVAELQQNLCALKASKKVLMERAAQVFWKLNDTAHRRPVGSMKMKTVS